MTFQRILIFCMLLLSPLLPAQAATAPISDAAALQGVKDRKGVFLVDFSDAKKTAFYLEIIKGTDLSAYSQAKLNAVARKLNERPRKTLNYETPAERFHQSVASTG